MADYFAVTSEAKSLIDRAMAVTGIADPVVRLTELAGVDIRSQEYLDASSAGADARTLEEIAERTMLPRLKGLLRLHPVIYPRGKFMPWNVRKVGGLAFHLPLFSSRGMKGGVLDVAERGLAFFNSDGLKILPKNA